MLGPPSARSGLAAAPLTTVVWRLNHVRFAAWMKLLRHKMNKEPTTGQQNIDHEHTKYGQPGVTKGWCLVPK